MSDEQVPPEPETDSHDKQLPPITAPTAMATAAVVLTLAALLTGGHACGDVVRAAAMLPFAAAILAGSAVAMKLQGQSDAKMAIGFIATALAVGVAGYLLLDSSIDSHYCA